MPELNPFNKNKDFLKEISKIKPEDVKTNEDFLQRDESLAKVVDSFGFFKLGSGSECFVVNDPRSKEKVIAVNYANLTPDDAKDIYYSSKIWSTLFPNNFPKMYSASAQNNEFSGTVRHKIHGKTWAEEKLTYREMVEPKKSILRSYISKINNYFLHKETKVSVHPFSKVKNEMKILNYYPYNLPGYIDTNTRNFIKTDDGNEFYLDTIHMGKRLSAEKPDYKALVKYMEDRKYSSSDIKCVVASIKRLIDIFEKSSEYANVEPKSSEEY